MSGAKDGTVRLWPTNGAPREQVFAGSRAPIKFSSDGRLLAAIDDQSRFVLLNLKTGEPEESLQLCKAPFGYWAGAVSDDLRVLVDLSPEGNFLVWDLQVMKSVEIPNALKDSSPLGRDSVGIADPPDTTISRK